MIILWDSLLIGRDEPDDKQTEVIMTQFNLLMLVLDNKTNVIIDSFVATTKSEFHAMMKKFFTLTEGETNYCIHTELVS